MQLGANFGADFRPLAKRHRLLEPFLGFGEFPLIHVKVGDQAREWDRLVGLLQRRRRTELELLILGAQLGEAPAALAPERFTKLVERIVVVNWRPVVEGRKRDSKVEIAFSHVDLCRGAWRVWVWKRLIVRKRVLTR